MLKKKKRKPAKKKVKSKIKKKKNKKAIKAKVKGEKILGVIEHYFDKISVAAIIVKSNIKVGEYVRIKGSTTDFVQRIDSIQIDHQPVGIAKKDDEIGIKVKCKARINDRVYPSKQPQFEIEKAKSIIQNQMPIFPQIKKEIKPIAKESKPINFPMAKPKTISEKQPIKESSPQKNSYSNIKFLNF